MNQLIKRMVANMQNMRCGREVDALPVKWKPNIGAPIVGLVTCRSPSAIILVVSAVIFFALQRKSFGAYAHICDEIGEISPSLADFYSAPSVGGVVRHVSISAAADHVSPNSIFSGLLADGFSVNVASKPIGSDEDFMASTRCSVATSNPHSVYLGSIAAVALAPPPCFFTPRFLWSAPYHGETTESLSLHFNYSHLDKIGARMLLFKP